jgi:LytS/YehU family sensor histidine kinase
LQDLGDVLRYSLSAQTENDAVELGEELRFVERYLAIERVRLGDRLRVVKEVAPETLGCRVPAFTLQPLVENAVRCAVASRAQGGRVRIEASLDEAGGALRLVVSDDGPAGPPPSGGAGLGLALVRQRLEAACGAGARMVAEHTGDGFVVRLRVPQPGGAP